MEYRQEQTHRITTIYYKDERDNKISKKSLMKYFNNKEKEVLPNYIKKKKHQEW